MSRPVRALAASVLALAGAATALAGVAVHGGSWAWLGLAVLTPAVTAYAVVPGLLRVAYVLGWFLLLTVVMAGRPEGDFAIAATGRGYGLLGSGLVLLAFAVITVRGGRPPRMAR